MPTAVDTLALANQLRPVLLQLNRHLRREAHELGITSSQASLLGTIDRYPELGVRELAARIGVSPPGITRYLDRLERAGLVTRGRDETDARRLRLTVTQRGQEVLDSLRSRRTAWLAERLSELAPED